MKNNLIAVLAIFISMTLITASSCKKEKSVYKCNSCASAPEALAANNSSTKGIYKGVVIGSSGTIKFNILNGGTDITAVMVIDGTTVNLTSTTTWTDGVPYVAPFTGTLNGQPVSITFSVDVSGVNPTVTAVNIPGHPNAVLDVFKETSTSQILCFEGTYSGSSSGNLNVMLSTTLGGWGGAAHDYNKPTVTHFNGTLNNNSLNCTSCASGTGVTGTLSGDEIVDGKWNDDQGGSGTWSAKRTM